MHKPSFTHHLHRRPALINGLIALTVLGLVITWGIEYLAKEFCRFN